MTAFAELVTATNFSFLHGASHGEDVLERALALKYHGLGIADRNTVAGVVRVWKALRDATEQAEADGVPLPDFKLATGVRLVFSDGTPDVVAYAQNRKGWGRLCRLLTTGNLRADKGDCVLRFNDLLTFHEDLLLIVLPTSTRREDEGLERKTPTELPVGDEAENGTSSLSLFVAPAKTAIRSEAGDQEPYGRVLRFPLRKSRSVLASTLGILRRIAPDRVWLGASAPLDGRHQRRVAKLATVAAEAGVPLLATNDALYASRETRSLQDILTCIRLGRTVHEAGKALEANAERHLKSAADMAKLFEDYPEAIDEATTLLGRIGFDLGELEYEYPHEPVPKGWKPIRWLRRLVGRAVGKRWPNGIPAKVHRMLREEIDLIHRHKIAYYFLTVHDVVKFARSRPDPILCQGAARQPIRWSATSWGSPRSIRPNTICSFLVFSPTNATNRPISTSISNTNDARR